MRAWRNALGVIGIVAAALLVVYRPATADQFLPVPGQSVGAIQVQTADGSSVTLGRLAHGHPAVIDFWAVWCPACRLELPTLGARRWQHAALILVSQGEPGATARFLAGYGISPQDSVYDNNGAVFNRFLVTTLPTTYFVNASGVIVARVVGPMTPALLDQNIRRASGTSP